MSGRAGLLVGGLVVVALAAAIYTRSVNRELAGIHQRLERVELAVAALATLPPGFVLDPPERSPVRPIPREGRP